MGIHCIAGLGNPGKRYEWTRHNIGFLVLDRFAGDRRWDWHRQDRGDETLGSLGGESVVLLKPMQYMNRSGEAVRECLARHRFSPEELLVVVDDAALPVGRVRIRSSGGSGGHHGLESIEEELESQAYRRLRIGVGMPPEGEDLADYLLEPLGSLELEPFDRIGRYVSDLLPNLIRHGVDWAMNRYNSEAVDERDGRVSGIAEREDRPE